MPIGNFGASRRRRYRIRRRPLDQYNSVISGAIPTFRPERAWGRVGTQSRSRSVRTGGVVSCPASGLIFTCAGVGRGRRGGHGLEGVSSASRRRPARRRAGSEPRSGPCRSPPADVGSGGWPAGSPASILLRPRDGAARSTTAPTASRASPLPHRSGTNRYETSKRHGSWWRPTVTSPTKPPSELERTDQHPPSAGRIDASNRRRRRSSSHTGPPRKRRTSGSRSRARKHGQSPSTGAVSRHRSVAISVGSIRPPPPEARQGHGIASITAPRAPTASPAPRSRSA